MQYKANTLFRWKKITISIEEKEYTKIYLINLKRDIGLEVKAQKPSSLTEAQDLAIEKEIWLGEAQPIRPPSFNKPIPHFL